MAKIYCAGPLFNDAERQEMALLARHLEQSGHSVFLPQRDGLEFSKIQPLLIQEGFDPKKAGEILGRAIFSLDIYKLLVESDAVVVNLNGRVPDEGAVVEATAAWHAGKPVVLYKNDGRSLLNGADNPMISGLGGFGIVSDMSALSAALDHELKKHKGGNLEQTLAFGLDISNVRGLSSNLQHVVEFLSGKFRGKNGL